MSLRSEVYKTETSYTSDGESSGECCPLHKNKERLHFLSVLENVTTYKTGSM